MRGGKGRHLGLGCLGDHDDHDLRAVLSRADEGDGTKVRAQKGRYMFFLGGLFSLYSLATCDANHVIRWKWEGRA